LTNKLSDKDKKVWQDFLNSSEKLEIKDIDISIGKNIEETTIDLHGYTLDEANKKIYNFISDCHKNRIKKINVITGKGMRSKNLDDPYQSKDLSILKYSVPEFVKNNFDLREKILKIDLEAVDNPSKGSFNIFLKSIK
tara:strand:+ start:116 stop:529 length:414 start_codon:yes stop_codon:yes gene_type:complete